MKIKLKNFYLFSVPVSFNIAGFKILFSNHLIVEIEVNGVVGVGEGVLYKTSPQKTLTLINNFKDFFSRRSLLSWEVLLDKKNNGKGKNILENNKNKKKGISFLKLREDLQKKYYFCPGVLSAFDMALWDVEGKLKKKPLFKLLKKDLDKAGFVKKVKVTQQLFINNDKDFKAGVEKILKSGTKSLKLKAGGNFKKDISRIKFINKKSNNKIKIQLDLNKSLSFQKALSYGAEFKKLGVIAWEEPLNTFDFKKLSGLRKRVDLPIILDESVKDKVAFKKGVDQKVFNILNIKFARLGGITAGLEFALLCKKYNIKPSIGCSEELGVGTAGQLHFALGLDNLYGFEALGSQRLGFDVIKKSFQIKNGYLSLTKGNGLGVKFSEKKLNKAGENFRFPVVKNFENENSFKLYYFKRRMASKVVNGFLLLKRIIFSFFNS